MRSMAANDSGPPDDIPDAMLEEAAIWLALLREPERESTTASIRQGDFERWRAADPRHRRAFDEMQRLWRALEEPASCLTAGTPAVAAAPSNLRLPPRQSTRWTSAPRIAAMAACLLVAVTTGLAWQDEVIDRLQSDYRTAVGEHAPLHLADGSRIVLNTDTAVAVDLGPDGRHVRLLRGEAWFDVAQDTARPFEVQTPSGSVHVTGTRFDVRLDGDDAVVSLAEGRVELAASSNRKGHAPASLVPGQQARLSDDGVSDATAFDRTAVTAWLRGQFVFYDAPLATVVAELNRYRPGRIVVANTDLETLRISGVFRTDDPDAALAVIADTLPVRITRLTDYLVLLR